MIKINLLRNMDKMAGAPETMVDGLEVTQTALGDAETNKEIMKKIGMAVVPVVISYAASMYVSSEKNSELENLNAKLKKIQSESAALQPQINAINKYKEESSKIDNQLQLVKGMSLQRYRGVKIMDAVQAIIPEQVWLLKMKIEDKKVELEGQASDDISISDFVRGIEESMFFTNVSWADSRAATYEGQSVKFFKIVFNLENI